MIPASSLPCRAAACLALLALLPAVAFAQGADRPAGIGVQLERTGAAIRIRSLLPDGPAARAGMRAGDRILAVDGRPVQGESLRRVEALLVGALEDSVVLAVASDDTVQALRVARDDVFAPSAGYTEAVVTPYLVVHHRPGRASRVFAERMARRGTAIAAEELRGVDTGGRRAHLYVLEGFMGAQDVRRRRLEMLPAWAQWMDAGPFKQEAMRAVTAYPRFGEPGKGAAEMLAGRRGWSSPSDELHRAAVEAMLAADLPADAAPDRLLRMVPALPELGASLRAYTRDRFGDQRFGELWRSDAPFGPSAQRVLGVTETELVADWRAAVLSLGPDPGAAPPARRLVVAMGWIALLLAWGMWTAARREVRR